MTQPFSILPLSSAMQDNLASLSYETMTPVQGASLARLLNGEDLTVQAETGSGKTAAFGISLVHGLDMDASDVQAMVLCPTRELAEQVAGEIRRLARHLPNIKVLTLCGGSYVKPQRASLFHGAHVVVGTPGRVEQHLREETLHLATLKTLVLDEADRMLEAGFSESLHAILGHVPAKRQTLLFSATFPKEVEALKAAAGLTGETLRVGLATNDISQHFFGVEAHKKVKAVADLICAHNPSSALCFVNTKAHCQDLAQGLAVEGFSVLALHGGMDQKERTEALVRFGNGSTTLLVATDVAARGLDIKQLPMVINADFPFDPEVYVHRIGRTGRAGEKGLAMTLMEPGEEFRLDGVNKLMGTEHTPKPLAEREAIPTLPEPPAMVTLSINGGRKSKLRPGDILGALTQGAGLQGSEVGRIDCFDAYSYVAVPREKGEEVVKTLSRQKIKGRRFLIRINDASFDK